MKSLACVRCGRGFGKLRGCCLRCYDLLRALVLEGKATWEGHVLAGECRAPKKSLGVAENVIRNKAEGEWV